MNLYVIKYEGKQKITNTKFIMGVSTGGRVGRGDQADAKRELQDIAKVLLLKLGGGQRVVLSLLFFKAYKYFTYSFLRMICFIIHILCVF